MSMRQVWSAELKGYGPPLYPEAEIWRLAVAFTSRGQMGLRAQTLDQKARTCDGFVRANRIFRTSDGCIWRRILEFEFSGKRVAVAIPGTQDWSREDGVYLDRSPAVYITAGATEALAKTVLVSLAHALLS